MHVTILLAAHELTNKVTVILETHELMIYNTLSHMECLWQLVWQFLQHQDFPALHQLQVSISPYEKNNRQIRRLQIIYLAFMVQTCIKICIKDFIRLSVFEFVYQLWFQRFSTPIYPFVETTHLPNVEHGFHIKYLHHLDRPRVWIADMLSAWQDDDPSQP